ncbi:MAG: phosphatidylserine decarboxylase [Proteobacteria bacterium]|nr:phosphatidylserine decarboxylase [Pseudomonadota bacterium]
MKLTAYLKIALQYLVPHHLYSRFTAKLAHATHRGFKNWSIRRFIRIYQVNLSEAVETDIEKYQNLNSFFIRHLKPGLRPWVKDPHQVGSPVDGVVSQFGMIQQERLIQAKKHDYTLEELLAGDDSARYFYNGKYATLYLAPRHYHRVHMPIKGTLREMIYVPGQLFSVNQATASAIPKLFARNERVITLFDTAYGEMAVILVGAMIVNGIHISWHGDVAPSSQNKIQRWKYSYEDSPAITLNAGDELGYFKFGSTVIVLFSENRDLSLANLTENSEIKLGELLATYL